jgi:SNF2 family DNA or RNA helicase
MPLLSEPIVLTREYRQRLSARAVPGAVWDPEAKAWVLVDPSPRAAAVALKMFPDLAAQYPELVERREQLRRGTRPVDNASEAGLLISPYVHGPREALAAEGHSFYEYQEVDLGYVHAVLTKHGAAYIGWERGLGKTLAACALIDATGAQRTLIVAPNTAKRSVWEPELRRFLPDHKIVVLPNEKAKRESVLKWLPAHSEEQGPLVLVVHYEALDLVAKLRKDGRGWDRLGEWDLIVADEAHRLKNPKAKMVRAIKKIPTRMKLALSGSIIENHAEELFSPLQWLFPDVYASKWRDWNDRFLDYVDGPFGKLCVGVKEHMLDAMRQELGVFMVYRRKEDELDLPEKTEQMLLVDLTPSQRRAYEDLRDTCVTTLDSGELVAADDGLVMLTRLRQIATGLDLVGEVADSSKLDVALELIEDNEDEAFVVFTWYKAAAYALSDRLSQKNIEHFVVTGDVDHATRADYIDRFQNGEARVFIGTIKTLGESVNLYRATNAIFLDRSWNPMDNAQAADRIYRIGQTQPVTITHLVARDTVDELRVQPALANKEALRRAILGGD